MTIFVREAEVADLDTLVALCHVVQSLHAKLYPRDFRADVDPIEMREFFATQLPKPDACFALAELDLQPVGYVWFDIQRRTGGPFTPPRPPRLYLQHICMIGTARRLGLGSALISYVEERASIEGASELALDAWADNTDAHAFFSARGFGPRLIVFRKFLSFNEGPPNAEPA